MAFGTGRGWEPINLPRNRFEPGMGNDCIIGCGNGMGMTRPKPAPLPFLGRAYSVSESKLVVVGYGEIFFGLEGKLKRLEEIFFWVVV